MVRQTFIPYRISQSYCLYLFGWLVLVTTLSLTGYGQASGTPNQFTDFNIYTPNAFAFSKVDNVKMNFCTGQIEPSVPILQKQMNVLNLDVTLNFIGGGGIKADDPVSSYGRGWMLNCGGMIIRTVRGIPDDFDNTQPYNGTSTVPTAYNGVMFNGGIAQHADGVSQISSGDNTWYYNLGIADSQHDIFEYNFQGRSGKFYIGEDHQILIADDSKIQIIPQYATTYAGGELTGFTIIDEQGIKYVFNQIERSENEAYNSQDAPEQGTYFDDIYGSAWYLSKIDAPSDEESIKFSYINFNNIFFGGEDALPLTSSLTDYYNWTRRSASVPAGNQLNVTQSGSYSTVGSDQLAVSSIVFSDSTQVNFKYFTIASQANQFLSSISVLNSAHERIRNYLFNYMWYDETDSVRYQNYDDSIVYYYSALPQQVHLESIDMRDTLNNLMPYYSFTYYLDQNVNEINLLNKNSEDIWGYYNGANNTGNLLMVARPGYGYPAAQRQANLTYACLGALKTITYPTGGSESFIYELNDELSSTSGLDTTVGGIRVKTRILKDISDTLHPIVKQYQYVDNLGRSSGFIGNSYQFQFLTNWYSSGWPSNPVTAYTDTTTLSTPVNPLSSVEGSDAGYRRVVETTLNGTTTNGQTVYTYTDLSYAPLWSTPDYYPYCPVEQPTWAVGLPLGIYQYDAAGHLLKSSINQYNITQSYNTSEDYRSLYMALYGNLTQTSGNLLIYLYKFKNYYPLVGRADLVSTTTYSYPNSGSSAPPQTSYQNTQYDPVYHFTRETSQNNSKGDSILTKYYYPVDYSLGAGAVTGEMVQENMIDKPVDVESWKDGQYLLNAKVTQYIDLGGGLLRPGTDYISSNAAPLAVSSAFNPSVLLNPNYSMVTNTQYTNYDNRGRLLSKTERGSEMTSVILDSVNHIIAKASNAATGQIAYASFEKNEPRTWTYSSAGVTAADHLTGVNSYIGNMSIGGLPSGNYRLRLWAKGSGSITVNGVSTPITGSWAFYAWNFIGITSIGISSSGNYLDEVSIYPTGSMMTSYTYSDGVGMTSGCDDNGNIIGYHYDGFNRLKSGTDRYGDYIKSYAFSNIGYFNTSISGTNSNYPCGADSIESSPAVYTVPANQYVSIYSQADANKRAQDNLNNYLLQYTLIHHPACTAIYYSAAQSYYFYKSCSAGDYSTAVLYTVPAGMFTSSVSQAAADNLAQSYALTNGQNYANANGSCVPYVTIEDFNPESLTNWYVEFVNTTDGSSYGWYIPAAGGALGQVPQGTYNITVTYLGGGTNPGYSILAGCYGYSTFGTGASFTNVPISSSCNTIDIE